MRLSVIIPAFNAAQTLAQAVESVRRQSFGPLEIIIVDDGSADSTREVVQQLGDEVLYIGQNHQGPAAARNRGLHAASGDLVAFLDADDVWADGALHLLVSDLEANPDAGFVTGLTQCTHEQKAIGRPFHGHNIGASLFRRSVFDKVGTFEESMRLGEDVDWFVRAGEKDVRSSRISAVTLMYRRFARDATVQQRLRQEGLLAAIKKSLDRRAPGGRPRVSVIMAVRNGERFLASAIRSVLEQDQPPFEIIVVDGQSTDRTADIARSFPGVCVVMQEQLGTADAYNTGIAAARGEFIAFNSHDDLWLPQKLRRQLDELGRHPDAAFANSKIRFFLEDGCSVPRGFKTDLLDDEPVGVIMETLLARREVFEIVGTFNPLLSPSDDTDWFARAKDFGLRSIVVPEVLVHKRLHDRNTSMRPELTSPSILHIVKASLDRQRAAAWP